MFDRHITELTRVAALISFGRYSVWQWEFCDGEYPLIDLMEGICEIHDGFKKSKGEDGREEDEEDEEDDDGEEGTPMWESIGCEQEYNSRYVHLGKR